MIPLRDDVPSRTFPFVTIALILVNSLIFIYQVQMNNRQLNGFVHEFAVVPARYFHPVYLGPGGWTRPATPLDLALPLFTSMFLHGGWLHLIGNMLYLWIFGDNVEDRLGHARFLIFYFICGLSAAIAHIWANPASTMPSLGASGAIAGVLGAYLLLYPLAHVSVLVPLLFFFPVIEVPALFFLAFWFLQQYLNGMLSLGVSAAQTGGVAWWAHIGGFAAGAVLVFLFARPGYRPIRRPAWS